MVKLSIQNEKCPTEQIKVRFAPVHKNKTNQPINLSTSQPTNKTINQFYCFFSWSTILEQKVTLGR